MSSAIGFLEGLGSKAPLPASEGAYAAAVAGLEVNDAVRQALLGRDARTLGDLIGGRDRMMMQIWAPNEETPQEDESPDREAPQEDRDDDKESERES